jgi:hypothetical protein
MRQSDRTDAGHSRQGKGTSHWRIITLRRKQARDPVTADTATPRGRCVVSPRLGRPADRGSFLWAIRSVPA